MAYETGTATNPVNLLDKLRIFCIANAITVDEFVNDGTRDILSISFGSGFFGISYRASETAFSLLQSTSFIPATAWGSQPDSTAIGVTSVTACNFTPNTAISSYHFFYFPGGMLYVAFLTTEGYWRFFGCGNIVKYGTYTGGSLIVGCYNNPSTSVIDNPYSTTHSPFLLLSNTTQGPKLRVDHNGSNKFYRIRDNEIAATRAYCNHALGLPENRDVLYGSTPSGTSQTTSTDLFKISINEGTLTTKSIPVGEAPDVRFINITYFEAEDTYDTDWKVFPLGRKADPLERLDLLNSATLGVIFRFQ